MQMQIHMDILSGRRQCGILKIMVNWKSGGLVFYLGFAINLLFSFHFIFKNTMEFYIIWSLKSCLDSREHSGLKCVSMFGVLTRERGAM